MARLITALLITMAPFISHGAELEVVPVGGIGGRIYATVSIDDRQVRCFLDTGANTSSVYTDSFFRKYASTGRGLKYGASGQGMQVDDIAIREIRIDACSVKNLEIQRIAADQAPDGSRGVAGIDCFANTGFIIDIPSKKLTCGQAFPGWAHALMPLVKNENNYIIFKSGLGNEEVLSIFDTGAGLTTVDRSLVGKYPGIFTFIQKVNDVRDAANIVVSRVDLYRLKSVRVADVEFRDLYVLAADFGTMPRIDRNIRIIAGFNMISKHKWFFDLKNSVYAIFP